jgi:carbon monoxide dehydrogenase subunit G
VKFENAFAVQAPIGEVWAALLDVERVAPCMPGAEVLEKVDDDTYKVAIKVRVGPIAMTYRGEVQITERNEAAHTATMRAKAREARGQGTADAHVHMSLAPAPTGGTEATLDTEVALSGRVAAMGQGVIADVSAKLVETFAGNLAAMLEPAVDTNGPGAVPATGASGGAAPAADAAIAAPAPARAAPQSTLPVGKIAAGVIAGRLSNPRTLAVVAVSYAIVFAALGFLIGRVA